MSIKISNHLWKVYKCIKFVVQVHLNWQLSFLVDLNTYRDQNYLYPKYHSYFANDLSIYAFPPKILV